MSVIQSVGADGPSVEASPGWRVQVFEVSSLDHQAMVVRAIRDEIDLVTAMTAMVGSTPFVVAETRDRDAEAWAVEAVVRAVDEHAVRTHVSNAQPVPARAA